MSEAVPVVAIDPSPVNDLVLVMSAVVPARDLGELIADPATVYDRHKAEIRLVSDLLFPTAEFLAREEASPESPSVESVALDTFGRERMLR